MNDRDWHIWLSGLIDGEGCFVLSKGRTKAHLIPTAQFKLGMRQDDRPILEEISTRLSLGSVYQRSSNTGPNSPKNGKPTAEWIVFAKSDIVKLVALLRRFPLRTRKARDFETWAEAVDIWDHNFRQGRQKKDIQPFRDKLWELKSKLEADRAYPE